MKLGETYVEWNPDKNEWLRKERSITFDIILTAIAEGGLLELRDHPNQTRHPKQKEFVVVFEEYVYIVPFVEDKEKIFLKTIFPNRTETKKYLKEKTI